MAQKTVLALVNEKLARAKSKSLHPAGTEEEKNIYTKVALDLLDIRNALLQEYADTAEAYPFIDMLQV